MDLNKPKSLNSYMNFINTPELFGKFLSFEYGADRFIREFIFGDIIMPFYMKYIDPQFAIKDICTMIWYL